MDANASPLSAGDARLLPAPDPQFGQAMREQVALARGRRRKIDRAITVATCNGWTAAIMAAASLPFAFFSVTGALVFSVLGVCAFVEFRGRRMLRVMDRRGPLVLAANQTSLGVAVILYAIVQLLAALGGESEYARAIAATPDLATTLGPISELVRTIEAATYALLILGTIAFQGGMALFYLTRRPAMRDYLEHTPPWVTDLLRAAA